MKKDGKDRIVKFLTAVAFVCLYLPITGFILILVHESGHVIMQVLFDVPITFKWSWDKVGLSTFHFSKELLKTHTKHELLTVATAGFASSMIATLPFLILYNYILKKIRARECVTERWRGVLLLLFDGIFFIFISHVVLKGSIEDFNVALNILQSSI